jgi:hypothetical protein
MLIEAEQRQISSASKRSIMIESNPVFQQPDGSWHFWDRTWADSFGPYSSQELAEKAYRQYGEWLEGTGPFMPPDEWIDKRFPDAFK